VASRNVGVVVVWRVLFVVALAPTALESISIDSCCCSCCHYLVVVVVVVVVLLLDCSPK